MSGSFSGSVPSCSGTQSPGAIPCGKKIPMNRLLGTAAVCASNVAAGIIESRSGKARVMPAPRRNVLRLMCLLEMYIACCPSLVAPARNGRVLDLHVHLERLAPHDAEHERG